MSLGVSETCQLHGLMGMVEQPACRSLACQLASVAETGGVGAEGFALSLETGLSRWEAGHSPLGPLCAMVVCCTSFS